MSARNLDEDARFEIRRRFELSVKGRRPPSRLKTGHDGHAGHWLELQMGLQPNGNNEPDIFGYEMKKSSKSKISFGDWSADDYIFNPKSEIYGSITRDQFLRLFGTPNSKKNGRHSWSGTVCPKIGGFNCRGQRLEVDSANNISAVYETKFDELHVNEHLISELFPNHNRIELARWRAESIKNKLEKKFGRNGFFICFQNKQGVFTDIRFGPPLIFENWISFVKSGEVYFDSGMYEGNNRPYSQWRASSSLWLKLLE